jgi:hypothetical protein
MPDTTTEWSPELTRRVAWLAQVSLPPGEELIVSEGETIVDVERYRRALVREAQQGAASPRATYGALQRDIDTLRSAVLEREFSGSLTAAQSEVELRRAGAEIAVAAKEGAIQAPAVRRLRLVYAANVERLVNGKKERSLA